MMADYLGLFEDRHEAHAAYCSYVNAIEPGYLCLAEPDKPGRVVVTI